jgi:nucleoside triphosphate pyrophosphatase
MAPAADHDQRLTLASTSPRRRELLIAQGLSFDVLAPHVDETIADGDDPVAACVELATRKAQSVALRVPHGFVVGADTVVWDEGWILGKPKDRADARRMLGMLSGRTHRVTTGYAAVHVPTKTVRTGEATARVTMRRLTPAEIDAYLATGEADDKAGAYGIQGAASRFVTQVEGPRDTVVGLPVERVLDLLAELGFRGRQLAS